MAPVKSVESHLAPSLTNVGPLWITKTRTWGINSTTSKEATRERHKRQQPTLANCFQVWQRCRYSVWSDFTLDFRYLEHSDVGHQCDKNGEWCLGRLDA